MSAVDDVRKLLQDLVTPDLKALETRVHALEEKMDARFKHLEEKMDLKFDIVTSTMAANQAATMRALDLDRRMERLEAEHASARTLDRPS